jgi:hypothetical protein
MINKDGATFYLNGNTWFRPAYGDWPLWVELGP